MLKLRITYRMDKPEELEQAIKGLEANFTILQQSKPYAGRGKSVYGNIYLDVEPNNTKEK
ncbi:MAG: hypothetical protein RR490_03350 [Niameybacter sp.]